MPGTFKLQNSSQVSEWIYENTISLIDNTLKEAPPAKIRILAVPVGLAKGILKVVIRIAEVSESIFKGLANLFGSPFCGRCLPSTGAVQLIGAALVALVGIPFDLLFSILANPVAEICTGRQNPIERKITSELYT